MKNRLLLILFSISLGFAACKKEETTNNTTTPTDTFQIPSGYIKVGESYVIGAKAKVVVYSESSLKTGYNKLHTIVYDSASGTILKSGHLEIMPMMDMGSMQHSSPVENQESETPVNNFYESAVIFTMPSSSMGSWKLHVHFHNHSSDLEGEAELDVTVANQTPARVLTSVLAAYNNAKAVISLIPPAKWKAGLNDFEITIHKMATMEEFPAVEDYTVEIEPEMPSMGHGSPNNVNPVHTKDGHYMGKVNFTMSGLWHVKLKLFKNGTLVSEGLLFEITL